MRSVLQGEVSVCDKTNGRHFGYTSSHSDGWMLVLDRNSARPQHS